MDDFLNDLVPLAAQARLVPAEQVIMQKLLPFETVIPTELSPNEIKNIEQIMLAFLHINDGNLSLQCSIRIASCLVYIYSHQEKPNLENVISFTSLRLNPATVYGAGHILDWLGEYATALIPDFVSILLDVTNEENMIHPCLFALNACFKRANNEMDEYANDALAFARKAILTMNESYQLSALKLLRTLVKQTDLPNKRFVAIAKEALTYAESEYVLTDTCYYIAKIAYTPFLDLEPETNRNEWTVTKEIIKGAATEFEESFEILSQFKENFPYTFERFLDLLDCKTIHTNLLYLFEFAREMDFRQVKQLISLFGPEVRKLLFKRVASEKPPSSEQLQLLCILQSDDHSEQEIAALSLQLISETDSHNQKLATRIFSEFAESNPELVEHYLETCMLYLAYPPEENPNLEIETIGFARIATHILGGSASYVRESLIDGITDKIEIFLNRALNVINIYEAAYQAAFMVMSVLSPRMIPKELVNEALNKFASEVEMQDYTFGSKKNRAKEIARTIALFFINHTYFEISARILWQILSLPYLPSRTGMLAILMAAPESIEGIKLTSIALMLLPKVIIADPSDALINYFIKNPIVFTDEKFEKPVTDLVFDNLPKDEFCYHVITQYPNLILSVRKENRASVIANVISNSTNLIMSHLIILALCRNEKTRVLLPKTLCDSLWDTMDDSSDDFQLQITAECIGVYCRYLPQLAINIIHDIEKEPATNYNCLILAAIFSHCMLDDITISQIMHVLDGFALNSDSTPYALHALSILYQNNTIALGVMKIIDLQFQVLFDILNSTDAFIPKIMFNICRCFSSLLSIVTPEIGSDRSAIVPLMQIIIQSFLHIPLPFADHVSYDVIQAIFTYARDVFDASFLEFPDTRGTPIIVKLFACSAFADMLKVTDVGTDFFDVVPTILILLQRTADSRASEFIEAIAQSWVEDDEIPEDQFRVRLDEWMNILKTILSNSALPDTGNTTIEACKAVKKCALKVAKILLPGIRELNPLPIECLDDLMSCITRSVETQRTSLLEVAYEILDKIIELFKDEITETGCRLLEVYDPQFSICIREGFKTKLVNSCEFLVDFIQFHMENMMLRPTQIQSIVEAYIHGLEQCKQRTVDFFGIASSIADIARENTYVFEQIKPFIVPLIPQFGEIVKQYMALKSQEPPDWAAIGQFREDFSIFYCELQSSFVWLQTIYKLDIIDPKKMISFFINEIETCTESWGIQSAFESLAAAFEYKSTPIMKTELIKAIKAVRKINEESPQLLTAEFSSFLYSSALLVDEHDEEISNQLFVFTLNHSQFQSDTFAILLRNSSKNSVEKYAEEICDLILEEGNDTALHLSTLLFDKCKSKIPSFVAKMDENTSVNIKFRFGFYKRALSRTVADLSIDKISQYAWQFLKSGGLYFMSHILIINPTLGVKIFVADDAVTLSFVCKSDFTNLFVFLNFMQLFYNKTTDDSFSSKLVKVVVETIAQWGLTQQIRVRKIYETEMKLLNDIKARSFESLKEGFEMATDREQQLAVQFIEKRIDKMNHKMQLKTFSTKRRTSDTLAQLIITQSE